MNAIAMACKFAAITPQKPIDFTARRLGLGGSDIASVLGINPFKTAYEVYEEKVEGKIVDLSHNEKVIWGNLLEEPIAKRYEQITNCPVFCTGMVKHSKYPFLLAHPDRIMLGRKGLEIKAVGEHTKHLWGEPGSQVIPEYYYAQIAHYLLVLDYAEWDIAVLIGGQELRTYTFIRDKEFDEIIIEAGSKFWQDHVTKKCPPEKDYSNENIQQLIKRKCHLVSEESINLPDEYIPVAEILEEAKEHIKHYEKIKKASEAKVLDAMQEAGIARLSDGRFFVRKAIGRKGYSVPDVKYTTLNLRKGA
jgi:putative phage-type endonuclease